jgi:hypothetical protein
VVLQHFSVVCNKVHPLMRFGSYCEGMNMSTYDICVEGVQEIAVIHTGRTNNRALDGSFYAILTTLDGRGKYVPSPKGTSLTLTLLPYKFLILRS